MGSWTTSSRCCVLTIVTTSAWNSNCYASVTGESRSTTHWTHTGQLGCHNCSCGTRVLEKLTRYIANIRAATAEGPRCVLCGDQLHSYHHSTQTAVGPNNFPIQWVAGAIVSGIRWSVCGTVSYFPFCLPHVLGDNSSEIYHYSRFARIFRTIVLRRSIFLQMPTSSDNCGWAMLRYILWTDKACFIVLVFRASTAVNFEQVVIGMLFANRDIKFAKAPTFGLI
jgi:hypothetical protein